MTDTLVRPTVTTAVTSTASTRALLAEVEATVLRRFTYLPSDYQYAMWAAWILHTHLRSADGSDFLPQRTPRLYFGSRMAGAGKTLCLDLTMRAAHNGTVNVSPTSFGLITSINIERGTIGLDEIDELFGTGRKASEVRTPILAGYKRGATVPRQRNDEVDYQNVHGPVAMAGKNLNRFLTADAYETLRTRSLVMALERKPKAVRLDKYRDEVHGPRIDRLSQCLKAWGRIHGRAIVGRDVQATMDRIGLDNRDEEVWSILFRIADHAGGEWPGRMEMAARAMVLGEAIGDELPPETPADELRTLVQAVFRDGESFLPTGVVLQRVMDAADPSAWFRREWRSPRAAEMGLSDTLGVEPIRQYVNGQRIRGYALADLVWDDQDDQTDQDDQDEWSSHETWDWAELNGDPDEDE